VLSVLFSPFNPSLIIGGTYSGQILIWDTRARSLPVLKTPLSATGHTHPVYSLQMAGTQNAHNLVSASTDGLVCSWTLDMLARPQDALELVNVHHNKTDEVAVVCMGFPDQETINFCVGTEEGHIYAANRFARAGAQAGLDAHEVYRSHEAPVTSIHFHPLAGPVDFSDLFLSTSMDWTTRLWRVKGGVAGASGRPSSSASGSLRPLHTCEEATDYVYDARWHPLHPALFAQVDGSGHLDLFNLNVDAEVRSRRGRGLSVALLTDLFSDLSSRRPSARASRSTRWHGTGARAGASRLAAPTAGCTFLTLARSPCRARTNGWRCARQSATCSSLAARTCRSAAPP
jgi:dynein intermediate chain